MYCSFFLQKMVTTPHKKRYVYPKTNHIMSISHMLAYPKLTFTPVSKTNSGNPYHRHPTRTKTSMPTCRALVVVVEVGITQSYTKLNQKLIFLVFWWIPYTKLNLNYKNQAHTISLISHHTRTKKIE